MQRVLFHSTIFGPIHSRRLGVSLGVNLTPNDGKICTFDCRYCEAGYNAQGPGTTGITPRDEVAHLLEEKLSQMSQAGEPLDVITFSGNGEPTVHPDFAGVIDDTLRLRDKYYPRAKVSVLTNATMFHKPEVVEALKRVDNNCLKIDSAIEETVRKIDRPVQSGYSVADVIETCAREFSGTGIIQTMIVGADDMDNSTDAEVEALIEAYRRIQPREVQIYSIDRQTPDHTLRRIPAERLREIAAEITASTGIPVQAV